MIQEGGPDQLNCCVVAAVGSADVQVSFDLAASFESFPSTIPVRWGFYHREAASESHFESCRVP